MVRGIVGREELGGEKTDRVGEIGDVGDGPENASLSWRGDTSSSSDWLLGQPDPPLRRLAACRLSSYMAESILLTEAMNRVTQKCADLLANVTTNQTQIRELVVFVRVAFAYGFDDTYIDGQIAALQGTPGIVPAMSRTLPALARTLHLTQRPAALEVDRNAAGTPTQVTDLTPPTQRAGSFATTPLPIAATEEMMSALSATVKATVASTLEGVSNLLPRSDSGGERSQRVPPLNPTSSTDPMKAPPVPSWWVANAVSAECGQLKAWAQICVSLRTFSERQLTNALQPNHLTTLLHEAFQSYKKGVGAPVSSAPPRTRCASRARARA